MSGQKETWKDIVGYEGIYQVSTLGNVRNIKRGNMLKGRLDMYGYYRVILYKKGLRYKSFQIHRLVAMAFIHNPNNKPQVDHVNTIRVDNRVENLRWVTYKENNLNPVTMERYRNMKRIKYTDETRRKMSESAKKRVRHPVSEETKHKQSIAKKEWWKAQKKARKGVLTYFGRTF